MMIERWQKFHLKIILQFTETEPFNFVHFKFMESISKMACNLHSDFVLNFQLTNINYDESRQTNGHRTPHTIFQINLLLRVLCITLRICYSYSSAICIVYTLYNVISRVFGWEEQKFIVLFVHNSWLFITLAIWWSQEKRAKSSHKWWWSAIGANFCLKADFKIRRSKHSRANRIISIYLDNRFGLAKLFVWVKWRGERSGCWILDVVMCKVHFNHIVLEFLHSGPSGRASLEYCQQKWKMKSDFSNFAHFNVMKFHWIWPMSCWSSIFPMKCIITISLMHSTICGRLEIRQRLMQQNACIVVSFEILLKLINKSLLLLKCSFKRSMRSLSMCLFTYLCVTQMCVCVRWISPTSVSSGLSLWIPSSSKHILYYPVSHLCIWAMNSAVVSISSSTFICIKRKTINFTNEKFWF